MHLHIGHNVSSKNLPRPIFDFMRRGFGLLPEYLETLRCFEFESVVNGKKVKRYHIYSPIQAQEQHMTIAVLSDLEKYRSMLLYEGYIDKEGKAYVADRRLPLKVK